MIRSLLPYLAATLLACACGPDPGNGAPCDGPEDCLPGLACVPGVGQCLHPCEDCDAASCITAAGDPGFFCPAPASTTTS